ncbi:MAG: serine/threonine-protein kinase, partial [Nocardioidaceae bacterium]|nr:serine/threonine-protein kinase [Nocardioidaceae bacterium]
MTSSPPPGPPTREGQVLAGRYRLGALIGRGGMAEVYRGLDESLGRPVAVKILTNAANAEAVDRHSAEAQIGARLNHPGLVAVYDVSTDHDPPFLVMELVEGITLADALERGPLSSIAVAEIGAQLLAAIAVVHSADVLHRDIKPSNVMVAEGADPVVKLTDFGISRLIDSTRLTSTGLLVGTARYLSPEQAAGEGVDRPTDVYAAGLVLLECLTGVQAFPGTQVETLSARLHRQPEVPAELGPGWVTVLGAMTQRDPALRPDAGEAAAALRTVADGGVPVLPDRTSSGTRAMGAAAAGAAAGAG